MVIFTFTERTFLALLTHQWKIWTEIINFCKGCKCSEWQSQSLLRYYDFIQFLESLNLTLLNKTFVPTFCASEPTTLLNKTFVPCLVQILPPPLSTYPKKLQQYQIIIVAQVCSYLSLLSLYKFTFQIHQLICAYWRLQSDLVLSTDELRINRKSRSIISITEKKDIIGFASIKQGFIVNTWQVNIKLLQEFHGN